ncbi:hypothetical protein C8R43DRAFT_1136868 [Mycena crocata]|nr:hypothetical protein C8R43DRAFT_1136868 [Mycena crocata]
MPSRRRGKPRKTQKDALPPGPPLFRFKKSRLAFLQGHFDAFLAAKQSARVDGFLETLYAEYSEKFPWRLPILEEPFEGMLIDDPAVELSSADRSERRYTATKTRIEIKSWFLREDDARCRRAAQ